MKSSRESAQRLLVLFACALSGAASADVSYVQCTIDTYRSSFAPRPELFVIQVDLEAGVMVTNYGSMQMKTTRRELRGVARVDEGWQTSVSIDRNSGRVTASVDKMEGRKYLYAGLKGTCILPPGLRGSRYVPPAGT
jgi:hypothetical protein